MSVDYNAMAGYGFKTNIFKANLIEPRWADFRKAIWNALPANDRKYYGNPEAFFDDDFEKDSLDEAVQSLFPDLQVQWYGNPYYNDKSGDSHLVLVKSTVVRTEGMVDMSKNSSVSLQAILALDEARKLFGDEEETPRWRVWLQVS